MGMRYGGEHHRGITRHSSSMHCVTRPTGPITSETRTRRKAPASSTRHWSTPKGLLELDAIYHFETSPLVCAYTEQPETVRYPDGNRLRRYTPDFALFLADGSSALIEIKHELDRIAEHFTRIRRMSDRVSLWL